MRVVPSGAFLGEFHRNLMEGRLAPAKLQRPYVWTAQDVEDFWESLLNGWPIGSFVLWEVTGRQEMPYKPKLGPVAVSLPGHGWNDLLLDGQNRLSTVAWSLRNREVPLPDDALFEPMEIETWMSGRDLVLDVDARRIRFAPPEEIAEGRQLPSNLMSGSAAFMRTLRQYYGKTLWDEDVDWLERCVTALREARVAVTRIEDATPAEAARVFRLVNKTGQPVTDEDMENAFLLSGLDPAEVRRSGLR